MSMTGNQIGNSLIDSINILINNAVADAGYDKTVLGQIYSCQDESIGCYKVKYQNSILTAYAADPSVMYNKQTMVYVQIPQGDMSKRKTILGSTSQLGTEKIQEILESTEISDTSGNLLIKKQIEGKDPWPLALRTSIINAEDEKNEFIDEIDITKLLDVSSSLQGYLKNSSHFKIKMSVKTDLPLSQRGIGEYGIRIDTEIKNSETGIETEQSFWFNNYDFIGFPYAYDNWREQTIIKNIDGFQILKITKIVAYTKDFSPLNGDEAAAAHIFINNLSLNGGVLLQSNQKNGVSLSFLAPKGYSFSKGDTASKTISVEIRTTMQKINSKMQGLNIYWFIQDFSIISPSNQGYLNEGGIGWKCINPHDEKSKDICYVSTSSIVIQQKDLPLQKETMFKCVVEYNNKRYEKTFIIIDENHNYTLTIESSEGTDFEYSMGRPTLTCIVKESDTIVDVNKDYSFEWYVNNNQNKTQFLKESAYNTTQLYYQSELNAAKNNFKVNASVLNKEKIREWEGKLATRKIQQYFYKNVLYNVNLSKVLEHSTFVCKVYYLNEVIGNASIKINNKNATSNGYELIINNGNQNFLYDENGTSLYGDSLENPYEIKPLSFTVFFKGKEVNNANYKVEWQVPYKNTLIICNEKTKQLINQEYYSVKTQTLNINVNRRYNVNKSNNDILLFVKGKDLNLKASTTFSFVKQGDNGTNGTAYQLKITRAGNSLEEPIFSYYFKKNPSPSSINLQTSVWQAGEKDTSKSMANWHILQNNGTNTCLNNQFTTFNNNNSIGIRVLPLAFHIGSGGTPLNDIRTKKYQNILQATVTIDNKKQYATVCIPTIYYTEGNEDKYEIKLRKGSGFRHVLYNKDGLLPSYDERLPFEVNIYHKQNDVVEDEITEKDMFTFTWGATTSNLSVKPDKNICTVIPSAIYYNTNCTYHAVYVTISVGKKEIGLVHIPIHFEVNRYSNPALNDWDGVGIKINNQNNYILSPQVGAGTKENNMFTGIVIGTQQINGVNNVGLFGYSGGQRSIFLDSKTGKSEFGIDSKSRIIIDPSKNQAQIYSGNYTAGSSGMLIDFSTPYIKFGSGNFEVSKDGHLTAKGGGTIANWQIRDDMLISQNGNVILRSNGYTKENPYVIYSNNNTFSVTHEGRLHSIEGDIGGWTIKNDCLYYGLVGMAPDNEHKDSNGNKVKTGVFWAGSSSNINFKVEEEGTFKPHSFFVTEGGFLYSKRGNIGGWDLDTNKLEYIARDSTTNKKISSVGMSSYSTTNTPNAFWAFTYKENSSSKLASQFFVDHYGNLKATSATIGTWTIAGGGLYSDGSLSDEDSSKYRYYWEYDKKQKKWVRKKKKITKQNIQRINKNIPQFTYGNTAGGVYIGADGIRFGQYFNLTSAGLTVTNGTIGSVTIDDGGLYADNWNIDKDGYAHLTGADILDSYVDDCKSISGSSGGSGISGAGVGIAPSGKTSYIDPTSVVTTDGGAVTLETFIKETIKTEIEKNHDAIITGLKNGEEKINFDCDIEADKIIGSSIESTGSMMEENYSVINEQDLKNYLTNNDYATKTDVNNAVSNIGGGGGAD